MSEKRETMIVVKRALLSCSDKTGLDSFAKELNALGIELVASGGTAEFLTKQHVPVKTVEAFAGITEQLDGRVKTLHPKIHAGILARRDEPAHIKAVGQNGLIDLVVVNLYPFEQTAQQPGVSPQDILEQIDIGGVALLRAAAKNFSGVAVVCQPAQYGLLLEALRQGQGRLSAELAHRLAAEAFELTSRYDQAIAAFLAVPKTQTSSSITTIQLQLRQVLRYGENPHQRGMWHVPATGMAWGLGTLTQRQGKELSANNLLDLDAALRCLIEFDEPACAIVKHHSLCGLATGSTIRQAYEQALACDSESAFGGIVGCNRPIDAGLAETLSETFLEGILAPSIEESAAVLFRKKPNVRVVSMDWPDRTAQGSEWRQLLGSWLEQEPDGLTVKPDALRVATQRAPSTQERTDLLFAWTAAKHVISNGIVLVSNRATVGIGQGQPSRVGSVRLAIDKAGARARGAVAASDGFFPFPDGVELLAKAGVTAVIQPGGSIRDAEVIAAANHAKLAMLLTGIRHFRH